MLIQYFCIIFKGCGKLKIFRNPKTWKIKDFLVHKIPLNFVGILDF